MSAAALALLAAALCFAPPAGAAVTSKEVEEALTCQCGCGLTVHSCNHVQCGSATPLKHEIAGLVTQNLERDEILIHFRDKYGEKILAAPTTEGFNLTAWILPFLAVGLGAGAVVVVVRRWSGRAEAAPAAGDDLSDADRGRLERALREDDPPGGAA